MGEFMTIGKAAEVDEGGTAGFEVEGAQVGVARIDGTLYAFSDICTHRGCTLSQGGELDGVELTCECHGSVFDVSSGAVLDGPATESIETYPAREMDGDIQIEV